MVTDPIQHDRAKGDSLRRPLWRTLRGASYSKYDNSAAAWGSNQKPRDDSGRERAFDFPWDNVGHGGFRLCLTMPRREQHDHRSTRC